MYLCASHSITVCLCIHLYLNHRVSLHTHHPILPCLQPGPCSVTSHLIVQSQLDVGKTPPPDMSLFVLTVSHFWGHLPSIVSNPQSSCGCLSLTCSRREVWTIYTCVSMDLEYQYVYACWVLPCVVFFMHGCLRTSVCVCATSDPRLHYLAGCAGFAPGHGLSQHHAFGVAPRPGHVPPLYRFLSHTQSE